MHVYMCMHLQTYLIAEGSESTLWLRQGRRAAPGERIDFALLQHNFPDEHICLGMFASDSTARGHANSEIA